MKYKKFVPLFCIAAYLLYRALSAYDRAEIVESIFSIRPWRLALGTLFVTASYFTLTLFDTLASGTSAPSFRTGASR